MPWAGTKDDVEGLRRYKEQCRLKNLKEIDIKKLTSVLYNNFTELFNSGIIVISGSVVYNALGLIERTEYHDLDINIKNGNKLGDDFVLNFKEFAENCSELRFLSTYVRDNLSATARFAEGSIDMYRPEWDDSDLLGTCEVLPGVYTQYMSDDYMLKNILRTYTLIVESLKKSDWHYNKIEKHKATFESFLENGDLSNDMRKKLEKILNEKIY